MSDKTRSDASSDTTQLSILGSGAAPVGPVERQAPQPIDLDATTSRDSFLDRVQRIAANIVVMKVTTVVGTLESAVGADELHRVTTIKVAPTDQQVASLSINMALGDTSLLMSQSFVDNDTYRKLHDEAVQQARAVRQETVELLGTIYRTFKDALKL